MRLIKVGTRGSLLARTQTAQTVDKLTALVQEAGIKVVFETVIIQTSGDRILDVALSKAGGKGLFTKEIEAALLDGTIDVAVHSMKDVPFEMDERLMIGAVPAREDARDAWLSDRYADWDALPEQAVVGTSSLRRAAAVRHARPDVEIKLLRGNVDTRYRKMKDGEYDAILLAAAGLHRLGWKDRIRAYVPVERLVPAVGQGALALQMRKDDSGVSQIIRLIHDENTSIAVSAERSFMTALEGSCQIPLGAYAHVQGHECRMTAMLASPDGKQVAVEHGKVSQSDYPDAETFSLAVVRMGNEIAGTLKSANGGLLWASVKGGAHG